LVRSEAARLKSPPDAVQVGRDNAAVRGALAERRSRLALAFTRGAIDEPTWSVEDASLAAELDGLADAEAVAAAPTIDWTWEPRNVNAVLRALFDRIQLGPDLRPLPYPDGFIWTVPEWRA
jgi:hypothetical protein